MASACRKRTSLTWSAISSPLENGSLSADQMDPVFRLLMQQEARLDRGELEDLRRRARLEDAWELWRASRVRAQTLPKSRLRATETPLAKVSAPCPPAAPHVDNFVDNPPLETAEAAAVRRAEDPAQEIAAGIDELERRLELCNLAASVRAMLDRELAHAGSPDKRLAVLTRWVGEVERAGAMAMAIVAGRDRAVHERSMQPPAPARGPYSVAPRRPR
jgi:hypothetical protein